MKLKFLSAICFFFTSFSASADGYDQYVNSKGQVSDVVVECLSLSGIVIEGEKREQNWPEPLYTLSSQNLEGVVKVVQGKADPEISWFRKGERWNMENPLLSLSTAQKILVLGQQEFGFSKPVYPKEKNYEGILVLGAAAGRVYERVLFTNEIVKRGTTFNDIYILTGKRSLEDFEKEAFPYLKEIDDEGPMMKGIIEKEALPVFKNKAILVYSEPPEGSKRATTESTVHAFMDSNPKPGKYLCVSNGIYVPYQELVIQNALDKHYPKAGISVECVGPANPEMLSEASDEDVINKASVFLDNLSRILYNLQIQKELKNDLEEKA